MTRTKRQQTLTIIFLGSRPGKFENFLNGLIHMTKNKGIFGSKFSNHKLNFVFESKFSAANRFEKIRTYADADTSKMIFIHFGIIPPKFLQQIQTLPEMHQRLYSLSTRKSFGRLLFYSGQRRDCNKKIQIRTRPIAA